ncbi:SpoIIE family protein phosphatase [Desulfatibacillum aliphaticivorans]|uniref:SpoIIE family protein phosphatase n=1 Tax=Desulfatibacillum aliphaticivorans TaxID=218208 RepID=UPI0003FBC4A2|nr:SpoIIE family protein phosphatase [Desulfatibacillum aliphaticivorans]
MKDLDDTQNSQSGAESFSKMFVLRSFRRRTVGGNFVGMALCVLYFVFFDSITVADNLSGIFYGSAGIFLFQTLITGLAVRRWFRDVVGYMDVLNGQMQEAPGIKEIAKRKVINLPYLSALATIWNWLAASLVFPVMIPFLENISGDPRLPYRMFLGILFSGVITTSLVYFNMELFSRELWPKLFPNDKITGVKGAWRMTMGTRIIISLIVTGVLPILMLSVVVYNKTRLMLAQNPESLLHSQLAVISFLLVGCTIATLIVARMAARSIVVPLANLERAIRKVEAGDYNVRAPLVSNDELGTVSESFNNMIGVLRDKERMKIMELEMEQGRKIQQDFLPKDIPEVSGWEIDADFHPARQVAGDFYDVFKLPGGGVAFVIADVCDKGVGSALFMALFRSLLRVYTLQLGEACDDGHCHDGPVQNALYAVSHTNDYIAAVHGEQGMFATVFLGVLDPAGGTLDYVNAGHEPPILARKDGSQELLNPTGPAAGLREGIEFGHGAVTMEAGDLLYGYTDGVLDARSPEGKAFSRKRILSLVEGAQDSAHGLVLSVDKALFKHMAEEPQFDDITMICLRRKT